jgi:Zn-dependent peptidase ImmA (M78 family)
MADKNFDVERIISAAFSPKGWIDTLSLQELFKYKLEELKISKNQALRIIDVETKSFDAFMSGGSAKIDYLTVLKLSTLLEIPPSVFLDKFLIKVNSENSAEIEKTKVRHFIAKNFDLDGLRKIGFIETVNDFAHIEKRILEFFGFETVFQYKKDIDVPVYSSGKINSNKESQKFWVNMAYATFERMPNPNEYDRQALVNIFPTLRAYTLNMELGLTQVMKLLYRIGITVVFIPKIYSDLHIRAATFCINDKPCVALTNYRDYYPTLWFALFHEMYHVLYDWDEILATEGQTHISAGLSTGSINEEAANEFAKKYLFDDEKMKEVEPYLDDYYYVKKFARSYNVHESIVYALYAYEKSTKKNPLFAKFKHLIPAPKVALEPLKPTQYENYLPIPNIVKGTMTLIN